MNRALLKIMNIFISFNQGFICVSHRVVDPVHFDRIRKIGISKIGSIDQSDLFTDCNVDFLQRKKVTHVHDIEQIR